MKKIIIIGAGPSGLFLALLLKSHDANLHIEIYEQNPANATFGFGVVMADTGLNQLRAAAPDVCADLASAMCFKDRQVIVVNETPITIQRPSSGGAIPRIQLLQILSRHAQRLGIKVHYEHRIESLDQLEADLIVGADGINSRLREHAPEDFEVQRYTLSNHFAWYGVAKAFEHPSLVFRKHSNGYFVAHYYPYMDDMSTFVAECDHQTWIDLGMEAMDADDRCALFETVFAPELNGARLISNNSTWRQFPVIRAHRWYSGNRVLIGDALNSAHFSIGSGTRIAMEDAIALAQALAEIPHDVPQALARFDHIRRPQKQKLITASEASFKWYENIRTWIDSYEPQEFVYRFMTRTGRVNLQRLREQYPALVQGFESAGLIPSIQENTL